MADPEVHPFLLILNKNDLADTLGVKLSKLTYIANVLNDNSKYTTFNIKKRDGGSREIKAPNGALKFIQRRVAARLELFYTPKICVHGYIKDRSILSNAKHHKKKKWVFKVDLQNFFPSIHFGRVHGLLQAKPFNFPPDVALLISQLCTSNKCLPQGAPTSPIISNCICTMLDRELSCLAQKYRCHYSRYADDLTFSTNLNEFPIELGYVEMIGEKKFYRVGKEIQKIITLSGFFVNEGKVALCGRETRQCVTGIVVNDKLNVKREYIRQVRSILHSWKNNGLEQTAQYYFENIDKKNRPFGNTEIDFANIVRGKVQYIGLVKGWNDPAYSKLASDLIALDSGFKNNKIKQHQQPLQHQKHNIVANVYTEGKTDVIHFEAALKALQAKGEFTNLKVSFAKSESNKSGGDDFLIKYCNTLQAHMHEVTNIVIGDRDSALNMKELTTNGEFKDWGNNVYSFLIPIPAHCSDAKSVCIEMLYPDNVLKIKDNNGRRLYLTSEFNPKTTKHYTEACVCSYLSTKKLIVETEVYALDDDEDKNLRLSKYDFAYNIANNIEPFTNIDFSAFIEVFNVIDEIIDDSYTKYKK